MKKRVLMLILAICCICMCACQGAGSGTSGAGSSQGNSEESDDKDASFVFVYNGMELSVNEEINSVIAKLGEPVSYYEAASCAFEGLDKIYTYSSFQLDTYPQDGKDMLASIYFKDDLVKTKEGISLYMTADDMMKTYGKATTINGNEYIYEKGNGCLRFIVKDGEIISIEYQTKVEYK